MPIRMRRPRPTGRKKARKPYKKRKSAPKSRITTFNKMLGKASEKKRFYISPRALTNGDITTSAPLQVNYLGNANFGADAPFYHGQQYANVFPGTATLGGWSAWDATPYPAQGNGFNQRQGASIRLMSSYFKFQITQTSVNTLTPVRTKLYLFHVKGAPSAPGAFTTSAFLNSTFPNGTGINANNGIIDYQSSLDPDHRRDYKLIAVKRFYMPLDNLTSQASVKEYGFGIKYNRGAGHTVRFAQNSTSPTDGQLMCVILSDAGNCGTYTYSGTGTETLINNSSLSGVQVNFQIAHYYIDP